MIKEYYALTKPGIIYGNLITAAGGFFLASKGDVDIALFVFMLVGLAAVIASSCVFNNYYDRDIDGAMERTKGRALVIGRVPVRNALLFGFILICAGMAILAFHVHSLAALIALIGFFVYLALYTPLKRRTVHGTLVGAFAGAVPPVVGYTAVTNNLDLTALLLFLILAFWQMPHFYAIALNRFDEYAAAKIPVWPRERGIKSTKIYILMYIVLFSVAALSLTARSVTGYIYAICMSFLCIGWFLYGCWGLYKNEKRWAKNMFFISLVVLLVFSLLIGVDGFLQF